MPKELANLPPLPQEQEEKMRYIARHIVELIAQKLIDGDIPTEAKKKTHLEPKVFCKKK